MAEEPNVSSLFANAIKTIWNTRPDLRQICNGDPLEFECWLALHGAREYAILDSDQSPPPLSVLSSPATLALADFRPTLTRFLHYLWLNRPDLQQAFPLESPAGQQGFLWWYFFHGLIEYDIFRLVTEEQKTYLAEPDPALIQDSQTTLSRLMGELWRRHPHLQSSFPLETATGRAAFANWYLAHGREVSGLGPLFDATNSHALSTPPILRTGRTTRSSLEFGVNLIGFARGEFGLGEDVRMASLSLRAAGIPCGIYNVEPGQEISQGDGSVESLIGDGLPYGVNLFCMTGIDMATLVAGTGPSILEGRRNIGLWPWELPAWPEAWRHAYDLVDELWAASRFTYHAFAETFPKPIRHVPPAVIVDPTEGATRRQFGLPQGLFLFVFSFDVLSSYSRKNPLACVQAFLRAFPRGDEPVGLVLKTMRAKPEHEVWQLLLAEAAKDARIYTLSETFSRARLLDLYRTCDCFMSLHRAEGFGRCIAEAMLLGKPVIATGFSGNLDFTTPATAALVDYRCRPVTACDYPFGEGQAWAEPDIEHAAWQMRRLVADDRKASTIARQGQKQIGLAHNPNTVGDLYRSIIENINTAK